MELEYELQSFSKYSYFNGIHIKQILIKRNLYFFGLKVITNKIHRLFHNPLLMSIKCPKVANIVCPGQAT